MPMLSPWLGEESAPGEKLFMVTLETASFPLLTHNPFNLCLVFVLLVCLSQVLCVALATLEFPV